MKKITTIFLLLLSTVCALTAAPRSEGEARAIAQEFFAQHATRSATNDVDLEWAGNGFGTQRMNSDEASLLYIYNRVGADGFVVVSGRDNVQPIIAYSLENRLDSDNMAPATRAILDAWCRQIEATTDEEYAVTRSTGVGSIAVKYETAQWNQEEPFNNQCPIINGYRALTGCVATAMSIICRYHEWPTEVSGTTPAYYTADRSIYVEANPLGPTYDYANMLLDYNGGWSDVESEAVATLMYDMGTSVSMMYHYDGSGAYDRDVSVALVNYFKYDKGLRFIQGSGYSDEEWFDMLEDNLSNYGPTYFRGESDEGGHAFVLDGYSTNHYFSINYGWGGANNGYYMLPNSEFYFGQAAIFELKPDKAGTSQYTDLIDLYAMNADYLGIMTDVVEYKSGESFEVRFGGLHNSGLVAFNGDVKLCVCDRSGNIKEELALIEDLSLDRFYYQSYDRVVTINGELAPGDRLRVYYKGEYSGDEWHWARSYDSNTCDEIIVCGSTEDIAKGLMVAYCPRYEVGDGTTVKRLEVSANMAIQWSLVAADGTVVGSGSALADFVEGIHLPLETTGEFTLTVRASGTEVYSVGITL